MDFAFDVATEKWQKTKPAGAFAGLADWRRKPLPWAVLVTGLVVAAVVLFSPAGKRLTRDDDRWRLDSQYSDLVDYAGDAGQAADRAAADSGDGGRGRPDRGLAVGPLTGEAQFAAASKAKLMADYRARYWADPAYLPRAERATRTGSAGDLYPLWLPTQVATRRPGGGP